MFKSILLAVDGSEHSKRATEMAAALAQIMRSDLWIVSAFEPIPAYLGEPLWQQALAKSMNAADQAAAEALAMIGRIPGEIKTDVVEGPAAEAILKVAESRKPDLIVMGSRGLGRLAGLLLGSQSQKVVQHAACPVLIVR
ncbi:MAG: universal stress protein [Chloroflexota bacterium]